MVSALVLHGVLLTYAQGQLFGRESYRDDGMTLHSEIGFGPQSSTVELSRAPRRVVWKSGAQTVDREIPAGTVVIENGSWQCYALAAEQFPEAAEKPVAVKAFVPSKNATLDATLSIKKGEKGARTVEVSSAALKVIVEIGADGKVQHASVPAQGLDVRPERAEPDFVVEEPFMVVGGHDVQISGIVWRPRAATEKKIPVVLIVHGSGSLDRNGPVDLYRDLAESLAARGIATARYDKRGLGLSGKNFDFGKVVMGDFIDDAEAVAKMLRRDPRFSSLTLLGHSEGALIGTVVSTRVPLDGFLSVAGAGRPFRVVMAEQIGRQLDPIQANELDHLLGALVQGKPLGTLRPPFDTLFPEAVQPFLRSELALNPAALLKWTKVPMVILQGDTDVQITVADAKALAAARPDAKLVVIHRMNHLLKEEAVAKLPQASYSDPSRPLAPGIIDAIVAGVKK
jgi:pimeloyl-ACP methyl ester carboxylesterase